MVDGHSIFCETWEEAIEKDERTNIQKTMFVLRSWRPRTTVKWLIRFIHQTDPTPCRAKAKAFACLFAIADESELKIVFHGDFNNLLSLHRQVYFGSRFEYFDVRFDLDDFNQENLSGTIQRYLSQTLPAGAWRVLFEMALDSQVPDRASLIVILRKLLAHRQRYLLKMISRVFQTFPQFSPDVEFREIFREIVSYPISCFISKHPDTIPIRPHHRALFRDVLEALAFEPFKIERWRIEGNDVDWPDLVRMLCDAGFVELGAEIGGHAIEAELRDSIMLQLLETGHFDEAIRSGFDREKVFEHILAVGQLCQATEILIDQHLDWFVDWLAKKKDARDLSIVIDTLTKQGRTKEARRIAERTAAVTAGH
jgi:hypothetical protein